jgi:hypothetical protein
LIARIEGRIDYCLCYQQADLTRLGWIEKFPVFAPERRLVFSKPFLPQFLPQVSIRDLKVGDASVDLLLTRHDEGDVGVNVLRRNGILDVVVLK